MYSGEFISDDIYWKFSSECKYSTVVKFISSRHS